MLLLPNGTIDSEHSRRLPDMSINTIWQLAQFKLATECMRDDHNLLLVVGHANLLYSLAASEHEQTRRFEEEFGATNAADVEACQTRCEQLYSMSEKPCSRLALPCPARLMLTAGAQR
jgi:hypothetical protein